MHGTLCIYCNRNDWLSTELSYTPSSAPQKKLQPCHHSSVAPFAASATQILRSRRYVRLYILRASTSRRIDERLKMALPDVSSAHAAALTGWIPQPDHRAPTSPLFDTLVATADYLQTQLQAGKISSVQILDEYYRFILAHNGYLRGVHSFGQSDLVGKLHLEENPSTY